MKRRKSVSEIKRVTCAAPLIVTDARRDDAGRRLDRNSSLSQAVKKARQREREKEERHLLKQ